MIIIYGIPIIARPSFTKTKKKKNRAENFFTKEWAPSSTFNFSANIITLLINTSQNHKNKYLGIFRVADYKFAEFSKIQNGTHRYQHYFFFKMLQFA